MAKIDGRSSLFVNRTSRPCRWPMRLNFGILFPMMGLSAPAAHSAFPCGDSVWPVPYMRFLNDFEANVYMMPSNCKLEAKVLNAGSHKTVPAPSSGSASALGESASFSNTAMLPEFTTEAKAWLLVAEAVLSSARNRRASVQPRALCFWPIYSAVYSVVQYAACTAPFTHRYAPKQRYSSQNLFVAARLAPGVRQCW